jgi:hypothetical protein
MRGLVLSLALTTITVIAVLEISRRPAPSQAEPRIITVEASRPAPPAPQLPQPAPDSASTLKMPEPVVIAGRGDLGRIPDPKLRTWVRRKANWSSDLVLYFEWRGGEADKMTQDVNSKARKYTFTLYPSPIQRQETLHRQIFIIPASYNYEVEIGKL